MVGSRRATRRGSKLPVAGAGLVLVLLAAAGPGGVGTAEARQGAASLTISGSDGALVVAGDFCTPNEPNLPAGPVTVTVTTWLEGAGHAPTDPEELGSAVITPTDGGVWSYEVPRPPLAVLPTWAETRVYHAEAFCNWAISTGFDYDPVEIRRPLDRAGASTTTTAVVPATTAPAAPAPATAAAPVSGTAAFTG